MLNPPDEKNVFLIYPSDKKFLPLFDTAVFAVHSIGFVPRCSKEIDGATSERVKKLAEIIGSCKYGIYDISQTEPDPRHPMAPFNLPLELGIDMGCRCFGGALYGKKDYLIMDRRSNRYRKLILALAECDFQSHQNSAAELIRIIREWLETVSGNRMLPESAFIQDEYRVFRKQFPKILARLGQPSKIPYKDYSNIIAEWLNSRKDRERSIEETGSLPKNPIRTLRDLFR